MKRQSRSAPLGLRLTPPVKIALQRAATDDQRSLASYVERLLILPSSNRARTASRKALRMPEEWPIPRIDKVLQHSPESASVHRDRRRALTEIPARLVVKDRRRK
jgi:hypothetical protein